MWSFYLPACKHYPFLSTHVWPPISEKSSLSLHKTGFFLCNPYHSVEQEKRTLPSISNRFLHKLTWIAYIKPAFFSPSVAFVILKVQMHLSHFPLLFHILKIPGFKDTVSACGRFMSELSKRCWRITLSITPRTLKAFSSSAGLLRFQEGLELSAPGG